MKSVIKFLFSSIFIFIILFFIVLFTLLYFIYYYKNYFLYLYLLFLFFNLILIVYILNKKQDPGYHISWLTLILSFPGIGFLIYVFLHLPLTSTKTKIKLNELRKQSIINLKSDEVTLNNIKNDSNSKFINYMYNCGNFPIYQHTESYYFENGINFWKDLIGELRNAKKSIFLEFFIIEKGIMWDQILDILKEKVKEKVEVRILYDGMCSTFLLPSYYHNKLKKLGIKCQVFAPIKNIISTYHNHRDHRKLCIIDGNIAYTGGINLSDDYINLTNKFGNWKDSAIKIKGVGVKTFMCSFLEMWNLSLKQSENFSKYLSDYSKDNKQSGYVLPYVDQPFSKERIGKNVYLDIINNAKDYIHIITPYLVLDNELLNQLVYAAKKKIKIQIIMPHIPDKKLVYYLGRSYYYELIDAGIDIYEYLPGFTHAKIITSDLEKAIVGSTNLDYRSLYLQYESNIYFYKNKIIFNIEDDFKKTKNKCKKITKKDIEKFPLYQKLIGKILRLFAPLL